MSPLLRPPTEQERTAADAIARAAATSSDGVAREMIAAALAGHRVRIAELVTALVPRERFNLERLGLMADGWTPATVHELVNAHRAQHTELAQLRAVLDALVKGTTVTHEG